jgi:hypothetical protein
MLLKYIFRLLLSARVDQLSHLLYKDHCNPMAFILMTLMRMKRWKMPNQKRRGRRNPKRTERVKEQEIIQVKRMASLSPLPALSQQRQHSQI